MHKMKGDCFRHFVEFATGETKSKADEDACVAFPEATKIAEKDLVVTHLVRLAMALSSSVFQWSFKIQTTLQVVCTSVRMTSMMFLS